MNGYLVIIGLLLYIIYLQLWLVKAARTVVVVSTDRAERSEPEGCACGTLLVVAPVVGITLYLVRNATQ